jgi:hypothetical protein
MAYVAMKYNEESGKAMISSDWSDHFQNHNLKEEDVYIFTVRDERNSYFREPIVLLRLVINKIRV